MNTFSQAGYYVDHTPSGADVTAGDIIDGVGPSGGVGVADNDIADGEQGALHVAGIYHIDNPDDTAFAQGVAVGYDATAKKAVGTGVGDFDIGGAAYAYVAGTLKVAVYINNLPG